MIRKQLVALGLSLTLLLTPIAVPAHAEPASFPDTEGHWAQSVLERWHDFGVIGGDTDTGAFRPDESISRAEFGVLLYRIMGYPLVEVKHFKDVPTDAWYAETMSRLNSAGIIKGDGNDMIRPRDPLTRQEASVVLCRALGIEEQKADIRFLDADQVSDWAAGSVGALYNMGAIRGWEGYFNPQKSLTRVQAVILLNNLIGGVMTGTGIWDRNVEGDLYVCTKKARLENFTVTGDLILSHGVASGDVALSDVTVKGDLIIRGGGENSIHFQPGCVFEGDIIVDKTVSGPLRLVNGTKEPLKHIQINNVDALILEGDLTSADLRCAAKTTIRGGTVETFNIHSPGSGVTVEKKSKITNLNVETEAKLPKGSKDPIVAVSVIGEISNIVAKAPARLESTGKIAALNAAASGVVLAGKQPEKITVSSGAARPKTEEGKTVSNVEYSGGSGGGGWSGGGGGGSSSSTPSFSGDIVLTLAAPVFGGTPAANAAGSGGKYTVVSTEWQNEGGGGPVYRTDNKTFTANQKYQAVITLSLTPDPVPTPDPSPSPAPSPSSPPSDTYHNGQDTTVYPDNGSADSASLYPPAARAANLYFGKPLGQVTVSLNGKQVTNISRTENDGTGTLTCTYVFPATEDKPIVENAALSITSGNSALESGQSASVKVAFTDNKLGTPAYQWNVNGAKIDGATGDSYTVSYADVSAAGGNGYALTCAISAPNYPSVETQPLRFTAQAPSGGDQGGDSGGSQPTPPQAPTFDLSQLKLSPSLYLDGKVGLIFSGLALNPLPSSYTLSATLHYTVGGNPSTVTKSVYDDYATKTFYVSFNDLTPDLTVTRLDLTGVADGKSCSGSYTPPSPVQVLSPVLTSSHDTSIPNAPPANYEITGTPACTIVGSSDVSNVILQGLPTDWSEEGWPAAYQLQFKNSSSDNLGTLMIGGRSAKPGGSITIGGTPSSVGNWNFDFEPVYGSIVDSVKEAAPNVTAELVLIWVLPDSSGNFHIIKTPVKNQIPVEISSANPQ